MCGSRLIEGGFSLLIGLTIAFGHRRRSG